jgi:hypothetical protein
LIVGWQGKVRIERNQRWCHNDTNWCGDDIFREACSLVSKKIAHMVQKRSQSIESDGSTRVCASTFLLNAIGILAFDWIIEGRWNAFPPQSFQDSFRDLILVLSNQLS